MGGLISYYAGIQYPHVFGRIGVFSPSFWIVRDFKSSWSQAKVSKSQLWFFYAGGKEGETMVPLTKEVEQQIAQQFKAKTYLEINPDGRHQESAWRQAFPAFLSRIQ
jgi:metallo-beta-lactamase class B